MKHRLSRERLSELLIEAKSRSNLEGRSVTSKRFSTLFTGLIRNSEHNIAVVYPMIFLLRRIAYATTIVFLYE